MFLMLLTNTTKARPSTFHKGKKFIYVVFFEDPRFPLA